MNNKNNKNGKKDWLANYIAFTSEQESPSLFHLWVGTSMVATALGRNVWINRGYYTLYPNLYIVLVGGSARVKKTTAISIGINVLKDALPHLCMISQKITPEALIGVFVGQTAEKKQTSGGIIAADELSVFMGDSKKDDSLMHLLTKMYDCPPIFDYHTMARGKETVRNVWINIIAGSTPDWIKQSMPQHAIGGGFTSRIIFVYQFEPEKLVPFPHITNGMIKNRSALIEDLKRVEKMKGEFTLSADARDWYERWYCEVMSKITSTAESSLDGYYGRKHDTLLKVAMCISASRGSEMVINETDLRMALRSLNENEKYLPDVLKSVMMTQVGDERRRILRSITKRGEMGYIELLRSFSYCMDAKRIPEVLGELQEEELVKEVIRGGKRYYLLSK